MAVSSISPNLGNSVVAATLQQQGRTRQTEDDQAIRLAAPTQAQQTQSPQQAGNLQSVNENESAARSRSETEASRPTVNVNGQVVGTRINTTA